MGNVGSATGRGKNQSDYADADQANRFGRPPGRGGGGELREIARRRSFH